MVAFDNDQGDGQSWHVSTDNKVKSSCVTSICAVAIDTGTCNFSNEQFKIANLPKNWLNYTGFVQKLDNIRNQHVPGISRTYEPCHEKTKVWHMRKQFQASSHLL